LAAERVHVTGSIKFDIEAPQDLTEKTLALRHLLGNDRLIWIAASTHATEEDIILAAHRKICEKLPGTLLILAPRHPDRFAAVFALAKQHDFKTIQRSSHDSCTPDTEVYVSDTMGELMLMYSVCDIAFVGGSFIPAGGHNMLEAAVLGKPVITGPQLFNFLEISENLVATEGMVRVENGEVLTQEVVRLLEDKNERMRMGENAKRFVDTNRGALEKHLGLIQAVLKCRVD
jgi:3-deoxy-D-manno-octulosonic-acid transferase